MRQKNPVARSYKLNENIFNVSNYLTYLYKWLAKQLNKNTS